MYARSYVAGLELARLADLPADVLVESRRVSETLAELHARQQEDSESSKIALRRKALLRVIPFFIYFFFIPFPRDYTDTRGLH
jgi:hypothetical protein